MFFPDPKDATKVPIYPLHVFNATWAAEECPTGDTKRHNVFCDKLVRLSDFYIFNLTSQLFVVFQVYDYFESE